jgi:hypothetical protein
VPDLAHRPAVNTTLGRVYTDDKRGATFRPSLFVTTTLDSYSPIRQDDHTPVNPAGPRATVSATESVRNKRA